MTQQGLGIDVGGSGIKGGLVNLATGELIGDRIKIATPQPATPDAVGETVAEIVRQAEWDGPVGIALPSVIKKQHALTAANIDPTWVNTDVQELFGKHLAAREVYVLNDADAAGIAEATFGTPEASTGSAILLTLGTGIGSAFLLNGELFPNTELGHLIIEGKEAEKRASSAVKERKDLSWAQWAKRLDKVLREYERLFQPDAFIVGGGVSRKHEKWVPLLSVDTPVIPAQLRNQAGIVGAAMAVEKRLAP
ncbi:ROK family protein [Corynebacterium hindlerae]|uniref:ROK family protein n=1 Tax=Corynebacterium hindlerae TaxID=699041 RepID=A0A7G5FFQ7_9CORY|nr:ROK family protein [Corynebacterium hindlerae]QMV85448.1 ROK family protein [Corynebacterium hindlerae]QTH58671.1 ROK family protein [Corynebacterium hindlerae]